VVAAIHLDYQFNKYLLSHPWLHFNVSHSEDFAVIAISRNKSRRIDIEFKSATLTMVYQPISLKIKNFIEMPNKTEAFRLD
jgi:phosphopantetheinyl transferase